MIRLLSVLVVMLLVPFAASAHNRSESHSVWQLNGGLLTGTVSFLEREATRIPFKQGDEAATRGPRTRDYFATRLTARSGAAECDGGNSPRLLPASGGYIRLEFVFRCPETGPLSLFFDGFFDVKADHVHYARIRMGDAALAEHVLTLSGKEAAIRAAVDAQPVAPPRTIDTIGEFVLIGMEHIAGGLDHVAFLLALMLLARRGRDIAIAVTGFTIGHSVTLALATLGLITPQPALVEAMIGFTIALVGIEAVGSAARLNNRMGLLLGAGLFGLALMALWQPYSFPDPVAMLGLGLFALCYLMLVDRLEDAPRPLVRVRLLVTASFGLIHGFGFAGSLNDLGLASDKVVTMLLGFNLGVELGQIAIVIAVFVIARLATRIVPMLQSSLTGQLASASLTGLGLFWFVERLF